VGAAFAWIFLSLRAAIGHTVVAVAGYTAALIVIAARHHDLSWHPYDTGRWLLAVAVLIVVGVLARRLSMTLRITAMRDALTGLPNRALALYRLEQAMARVRRTGSPVAVLLLDLDGFKTINDSLGHHAGDDFLVALAPRLKRAVRPADTVARLGGDEFLILAEGLAGDDAFALAQRLLRVANEPIRISGRELVVTVSIGVAVCDAAGSDSPHALLRDADVALHRAKDRGRGRVETFDAGLRARAVERLQLEIDLRDALAAGDISVAFQPVVGLEQMRVIGVEALARWTHPELGPIPPDRFIAIAEDRGLIGDLGRQVLAQACTHVRRWQQSIACARALRLSVNVSTCQLGDRDLVEDVSAIARDLPPSTLLIEVTESALMEASDQPLRTLEALRDRGFTIVLDDFGTGYSSLSYLQRIPLDALKIDRSFIGALDFGGRSVAITEAILAMGHALGLSIVAEGIENPRQLDLLRGMGCEQGQGWLMSAPLPPQEMEELLAAGGVIPAPLAVASER